MTAIASLLSSTAAMPPPAQAAASPSLTSFLDLLQPQADAALPEERQDDAVVGKELPRAEDSEDALAWLSIMPTITVALAAPADAPLPGADGTGEALSTCGPRDLPSPIAPLVAPTPLALPGTDGSAPSKAALPGLDASNPAATTTLPGSDGNATPRNGIAERDHRVVEETDGAARQVRAAVATRDDDPVRPVATTGDGAASAAATRQSSSGEPDPTARPVVRPSDPLPTARAASSPSLSPATPAPADAGASDGQDNAPPVTILSDIASITHGMAPGPDRTGGDIPRPSTIGSAFVEPLASAPLPRPLAPDRAAGGVGSLFAGASGAMPSPDSVTVTDPRTTALPPRFAILSAVAPTARAADMTSTVIPAAIGAPAAAVVAQVTDGSNDAFARPAHAEPTAPALVAAPPAGAPAHSDAAPVTPLPTVAPAARVFAAAIRRALGQEDEGSATEPAPLAAVATPVLGGTVAAQGAKLDMRQEHWPAAMIERIVTLRDMAAENDTRLRLSPDMLGTIDVSLKRDGDAVQVQITAEQAQTRQLLADAQPRLAELADARGVKLQFSGGQAGSGDRPGGDAPRHHPSTPVSTRRQTAAHDDAGSTDQRIA